MDFSFRMYCLHNVLKVELCDLARQFLLDSYSPNFLYKNDSDTQNLED